MRHGGVRLLIAGTLAVGLLAACSGGTGGASEPAPQPLLARTRSASPAPAAHPSPAPTALPAAPVATTPPGGHDALTARIAGLLAHPDLAGALVGVSVLDEEAVPVFERRADDTFLPASTQKLLPAAAALVALGPDHRYTTELRATAAAGPDGVLSGDLVLVGSGDPALATPLFGSRVAPERPRTPLEALAEQVVAAGVRRITGGVLGDPSVLADDPVPEGWPPRYFDDLDAVRISGLTIDAGRKMSVHGDHVAGQPAPDPAAEAAASLYTLLRQRGVAVDGGVAVRHHHPAPVTLGSVQSPPLLNLLVHTVRHSDNHMAEQIFRTLGADVGHPTWAGSIAAVRHALAPLELDWTKVVIADGSGLSRLNGLPPRLLTHLDAAMSRSRLADEWETVMARAGRSGTLRGRLRGTIAEGRFRGKTGSLRDVRALAGAVAGPDGSRYYVTLIANNLSGPSRPAVRLVANEIVLTLAEDLHDCVRAPRDTNSTGPPPAPPYELVCTR